MIALDISLDLDADLRPQHPREPAFLTALRSLVLYAKHCRPEHMPRVVPIVSAVELVDYIDSLKGEPKAAIQRSADDRADAKRWRAVKEQIVGADFAWGEPPEPVVCFLLPDGMSVSADANLYADQLAAAGDQQHTPVLQVRVA